MTKQEGTKQLAVADAQAAVAIGIHLFVEERYARDTRQHPSLRKGGDHRGNEGSYGGAGVTDGANRPPASSHRELVQSGDWLAPKGYATS